MERLADILRALARRRVLRRLRTTRAVDRLADGFNYGRIVRETLRFTARELFRPGVLASYTPRGHRLRVVVRHRTSDRYILGEIFRAGLYELPAGAKSALAAVGRPVRAVDLGGHIGLFGVHFLSQIPDADVLSVEADAANADVLTRCIARNGLSSRWRLVNACACNRATRGWFVPGLFAESHLSPSFEPGAVEVRTADVLPDVLDADAIKLDIEGAEWPILLDERFRRVQAAVISLEYHPAGCPSADPRQLVLGLLTELGYEVNELALPFAPDGVGMVVAWRKPDKTSSSDAMSPGDRAGALSTA